MSSKTIVVIGATGNQGGSVVDTFLKESSWTIRGLTRNPDSPASEALKARGVQMVAANLDDVQSLLAAFEGAHVIFSMLDFWTGFWNPANRSKLAAGQTMYEWAHDYELQQGKNVLDAAARTHGLERLIFSALSYASRWSGGKYSHVYHFDAEGRAVEYGHMQHPALMMKTSVIQLGMYLSNFLLLPPYQPHKNEDGALVISTKIPPHVKVPLVATNEDTGPLTRALLNTEPGKNLVASRELMSFSDFTETWSRVTGVQCTYEQVEPEAVWVEWPDIRQDIEEAAAYLAEFGFAGGDPTAINPEDLGVSTAELGTVAQWIEKQDWSAFV